MRTVVFLIACAGALVLYACSDATAPASSGGASNLARIVSERCAEDAGEVQRMAEYAVDALADDYGKRVSVRDVLFELDDATAGRSRVDCAEALAVLIVLMGGD